jgi:hypothetical protein
MEFIDSLFL